ncbi:unnamed protein product [Phaeothamnion confervicola]
MDMSEVGVSLPSPPRQQGQEMTAAQVVLSDQDEEDEENASDDEVDEAMDAMPPSQARMPLSPGESWVSTPPRSPGIPSPGGAGAAGAPSSLDVSPRSWGETDGEKGRDMVMDVLKGALDLAKAAVSHDERQAPPEKVLPYYEKAIRAIDTALKLLPEEVVEQTGMRRHREAYRARVDQLRLAVTRDRDGSGPASATKPRSRVHQSRVPFEQLELDPNHTIEPAPDQLARRPYWIMRLVMQTIEQGGYITPRLFAPRGVWTQVGVKFTGFAQKVNAMEALLVMTLQKVIVLPKPTDAESRRESLRVFMEFRHQVQKLQNDLSRPFPFISEVVTSKTAKATVSPKTNLGRFNHMVKNIGRNVKNTAAVAYERIGASVPGKAGDDELVYYSQVLSTLCSKCQVFDQWFSHLQKVRSESDSKDQCTDMDELLLELCHIAEFMREVICEIILRDLENLLERYLKKMRKSYARMVWDDDSAVGWGAGDVASA